LRWKRRGKQGNGKNGKIVIVISTMFATVRKIRTKTMLNQTTKEVSIHIIKTLIPIQLQLSVATITAATTTTTLAVHYSIYQIKKLPL
jgi:hypothetical protein